MGLRYVWDKYAVVENYQISPNQSQIVYPRAYGNQTLYWGYQCIRKDNKFEIVSPTPVYPSLYGEINVVANIYCMIGSWSSNVIGNVYYTTSDCRYSLAEEAGSGQQMSVLDGTVCACSFSISKDKGDYIDTISFSENKYSANGVSGSYWYTLKGSDSIDPTAINYNSEFITNKEIVISLNKPTPVYGGTVSYLYEYDIDSSGVWQTIKNTTEDSIVFLVPESVTSTVQFRVTASDDMGYTSTTPVVGPLSNIITEKDYSIRLHKKMSDNSYKTVYLETSSLVVKVGNDTLEDILTQIESDIAALKG